MVVSVMHDITQMKELEEKKDAFISMASHELKTPLTSIKVFVQILRRKLVNADTAIILKNIEEQIDKLTMLVRELLDISRMKKGKFLLNKEKISIKKLLQDAVATLSPVTNHHIYISSCINKKVLIDKERIYQVLVNLITNAIKYSPDHTDIILSAKEKDKNVIFSIKDYGIGISPEEQSKIFEQFYQVSTNHGNTFPGLGLGLYISSEIVKAHNGKIWLKSIPSKGSTFYFSIPIDNKI